MSAASGEGASSEGDALDAFYEETSVNLEVLKQAHSVLGSRFVVFAVICFAGFIATSGTIAFGIVSATLASDLDLTVIQSAMLSASPLLSAFCLAVPVSLIARSIGGRMVLFSLLVISGSSILVIAGVLQWVPLAQLPSLYPLFVIMGLGVGFGLVNINSSVVQLSEWFPRKQNGTVLGVFLFSVSMGPAVFGAFADPAIETMTLPGFFLLWGLFFYIAGAIVLVLAHNPPYIQLSRRLRKGSNNKVESLPGTSSRNLVAAPTISQAEILTVCRLLGQDVLPMANFSLDLKKSLTRLTNWMVITVASLSLGCLLGTIVWIPTFFEGIFGTASRISGFLVFGYGAASALGCGLGGILADRFNFWIVGFLFNALSMVSFVVVGVSTVFGVTVGAIICVGFFSAGANTSAYKLVFAVLTEGNAGTVGWMESGGNLMSFCIPLIFGAIVSGSSLASEDSLRLGMAVPASFMLVCIVALIICYWNQRRGNA